MWKMLTRTRWMSFCHLVLCVHIHSMVSTNTNGTSTTSSNLNTTSIESIQSSITSMTPSLTTTTPTLATDMISSLTYTTPTLATFTSKQTSTTEMYSSTTSMFSDAQTPSTTPTESSFITEAQTPLSSKETTLTTIQTTTSEATSVSLIIITSVATTELETTTDFKTTDITTTQTTSNLNNDTVSNTTLSQTPSTTKGRTLTTPQTTNPVANESTEPSAPEISQTTPAFVDETNLGVILPVVFISILLLLLVMVLLVLMKRNNGLTQGAISFKKKRIFSTIIRKRPFILENIAEEVKFLHKDDNLLFSLHFEDLAKLSPAHSTQQAMKEENKWKNRFINVVPFDFSRVLLPVVGDDTSTDYINANYIPGYNSDREYIATQGPLPNTINDFWRMIWHHKISTIVMLTPLKENEKVKCEQYWPDDDEPIEYGDYVIEKSSSVDMETYVCTTFNISADVLGEVETRTLKHYHYQHWRDMSAAVERSEIIDFIRTVRLHLKPEDTVPIVVHCSAGVGRTGTYIVLDYIQQFIQQHDLYEKIDIFSFVLRLRNCRVLMIQTESQYRFLYDCAVFLVEEKKNRVTQGDVEKGVSIYENTRQKKKGQMTTIL